jgi:hypothetical protein
MIGKLVRTKKGGPFAPKGTWGIVVEEEPIGRLKPGERMIYTVHLSQEYRPKGRFYRHQLQVVEVCSA